MSTTIEALTGTLAEREAVFQRITLRHELDRQQGNRTAAARALGISRSRLYVLLDRLGLAPARKVSA